MADFVGIKKQSRMKKYSRQEKILLPIFHGFLFILVVWAFLPIVYVLMNSLKDVTEFNNDTLGFPSKIAWSNYKNAFTLTYRNTSLMGMFFNSLIFTLTFSSANVFSSCMAAYVISKFRFRGRGFIYGMVIVVQILPIYGGGGAGFILASDLGLVDNIWLLWITSCGGFDYTFLIVHSYFENVSNEYAEAAYVDGAGNFFVFLRIMLPMVIPAVMFFWLSAVISLWNDYMTPMMYLPSTPTLASGIYNLSARTSFAKGGKTTYFAALIISVIPVVALFLCTQSAIFKIDLDGGLKG